MAHTQTSFQNGAVEDQRPIKEKEQDFTFDEIVASADPVDWKEKDRSTWRKFPIFAQNGSGSCVAQTSAKEMGIMRWLEDGEYIHFSATHIYQQRFNRPNGGMAAVDARRIVRNSGATLEVLAPSQSMTDAEMDGQVIESYKKEVGKVFAVPNYIELPTGDIDKIASVIQKTGKGVMVWFYFLYKEWTNVPVIKNKNLLRKDALRHSVCAVDYTIYNGKKALIIEDSWGEHYGFEGQRVITEDFFNARNWYAGYLVNFRYQTEEQKSNNLVDPKIKHTFSSDLFKGQKNSDVQALQKILKHEGLFPSNVDCTGYYWSVTAQAVDAFQRKYNVASKAELDSVMGSVVGEKTRKKLNELYS